MELTNTFTIARNPTEVFSALLDIERVATCMPGSTLTGHPEANVYQGDMKIKLGPLTVAYAGVIEVVSTDEENRRLELHAKGRERKGAGSADALIVAVLEEAEGGRATEVRIETDLNLQGKVAQFGRGVIADVAGNLVGVFADNLENLLGGTEVVPDETSAATVTMSAPASQSEAANGLDAWTLVVRPLLAGQRIPALIALVAVVIGFLIGRGSRRG